VAVEQQQVLAFQAEPSGIHAVVHGHVCDSGVSAPRSTSTNSPNSWPALWKKPPDRLPSAAIASATRTPSTTVAQPKCPPVCDWYALLALQLRPRATLTPAAVHASSSFACT
jgi:hypothetical protein